MASAQGGTSTMFPVGMKRPVGQTFDVWMAEVNVLVIRLIGVEVADVPDLPYADWFEDGVSVQRAANRVVLECCAE